VMAATARSSSSMRLLAVMGTGRIRPGGCANPKIDGERAGGSIPAERSGAGIGLWRR
jgi:hypothetical protein